jgi:hypothetical protein
MAFVIVVGDLISGVAKMIGTFDSELDARNFAYGGGEDRYEAWFTTELTLPQDEPTDD